MRSCDPADIVSWLQRLVHQILLLEDATEGLLDEVVVVVEGLVKALSG